MLRQTLSAFSRQQGIQGCGKADHFKMDSGASQLRCRLPVLLVYCYVYTLGLFVGVPIKALLFGVP